MAVVSWLPRKAAGLLLEWCKSGQSMPAAVGKCSWDNDSFVVVCMVYKKSLEDDNLVEKSMDMRNC